MRTLLRGYGEHGVVPKERERERRGRFGEREGERSDVTIPLLRVCCGTDLGIVHIPISRSFVLASTNTPDRNIGVPRRTADCRFLCLGAYQFLWP